MLNEIIFFSIVLMLMHAVKLFTIFFIMLFVYRSVTDRALILSLKVSYVKKLMAKKNSCGKSGRPYEYPLTMNLIVWLERSVNVSSSCE